MTPIERLATERFDYLCRVACRYLRDYEDARDVVQEALLRAWLRQAECRGQWEHWLCEITVTEALLLLRRQKRQTRRIPAWEYQLPRCDNNTPESFLIRQDLRREVSRLPRMMREQIQLVDLDGMTSEEVAATLGIGYGASKFRLHRARVMLRERLTERRTHASV